MKDFEELKNMWQQQQPQPVPGAESIMARIADTRKQLSQSLLKTILQLIPAIVVVLAVALLISFQSTVTYVGIVIILGCVIVYGWLLFNHYQGLTKNYSMLKPADYLNEMEKQYLIRKKFNSTGSLVYTLILFLGVILYMIEVIQNFSLLVKVVAFAIVTGWFLFVYLVLSKKMIKTENEKFENIINELNYLKKQFD